MTASPIENPNSPQVELQHGLKLSPNEIGALTAANATTSPERSYHEALLAYQVFAIRHMRKSLINVTIVNDTVIRQALDTAWRLFSPAFKKATGPMIAEAYITAFRDVNEGNVPITLIYQLADQHAERVGAYFNETSTEALIQGFNTYVNRQVPQRAAIERVLDAYGLTPKQMSGLTSAVQLNPQVIESSVPQDIKRKIKQYIGKSLAARLGVFKRQEAHNLEMQAKQVAWLWLVDNNKLPGAAQKMWLTAGDEKVCTQCGPMHRKKVAVKDKFELPNGNQLFVPGAHVNCRCQVRLQVNPFEVVGKADWDAQKHPRGKGGRFAAKKHEVTDDDRDFYRNERCFDLALSLHKKTGHPIYVIADEEDGIEGWIHAGVLDEETDEFIDVFGRHDVDDLMDEWGDFWAGVSDVWLEGRTAAELRKQSTGKITPRSNRVAQALLDEQDEQIQKSESFDPKEHPRGGDPRNRGRFSRVAAKPSAFLEETVAEAEKLREEPVIEAAPVIEEAPVKRDLEAPKKKRDLEAPKAKRDLRMAPRDLAAPEITEVAPAPVVRDLEAPKPEPVKRDLAAPARPKRDLEAPKRDFDADYERLLAIREERLHAQQVHEMEPTIARPTRRIKDPAGNPVTGYFVTNLNRFFDQLNQLQLTSEDPIRLLHTWNRQTWLRKQVQEQFDQKISEQMIDLADQFATFYDEDEEESYFIINDDITVDSEGEELDPEDVIHRRAYISKGDALEIVKGALYNVPEYGEKHRHTMASSGFRLKWLDDQDQLLREEEVSLQEMADHLGLTPDAYRPVVTKVEDGYKDAYREDDETWKAPGTYTAVNQSYKTLLDSNGEDIPYLEVTLRPQVRESISYVWRGLYPEDKPPS